MAAVKGQRKPASGLSNQNSAHRETSSATSSRAESNLTSSELPDSEGFYNTIVVKTAKPKVTPLLSPPVETSPPSKKRKAASANVSSLQTSADSPKKPKNSETPTPTPRTPADRGSGARSSRASESNRGILTSQSSSPSPSIKANSAKQAFRAHRPTPNKTPTPPRTFAAPARIPLTPSSPPDPPSVDFSAIIRDVGLGCAEVSGLAQAGVNVNADPGIGVTANADLRCTASGADAIKIANGDGRGDVEAGTNAGTGSSSRHILRDRVTRTKSPAKVKKPRARQRYNLRDRENINQGTASPNLEPYREVYGVDGKPVKVQAASIIAWPANRMPVAVNFAAHGSADLNSRNMGSLIDENEGIGMPNIYHSTTFYEQWKVSYVRESSFKLNGSEIDSSPRRSTCNRIRKPCTRGENIPTDNSDRPRDSPALRDTIIVAPGPTSPRPRHYDLAPALSSPTRIRTPSLSISTSDMSSLPEERSPVSPSPRFAVPWPQGEEEDGGSKHESKSQERHERWGEEQLSDVTFVVDIMNSGSSGSGDGDGGRGAGGEPRTGTMMEGCEVLLEAADRMGLAGLLCTLRLAG